MNIEVTGSREGLHQMEHPQIKGHMVNILVAQPKQTTAEARAFRKSLKTMRNIGQYSQRKDYIASIQERGAAKILSLCSSHIYATKPN